MMRYAEDGLHPVALGQRHQPGGLAARAGPRSARSCPQDRLFLVVQDIFLTETAQLADVVLPAATWGEKTGTFTNVDRTVHLSDKAVDPPGRPAPTWTSSWTSPAEWTSRTRTVRRSSSGPTPRRRSRHGRSAARGRPCDYTRSELREAARRQRHPVALQRRAPGRNRTLYVDGKFWAEPDYCESTARDLITGAPLEPTEYRAMNPDGQAIIKAATTGQPTNSRAPRYPYVLITGRTLYHFHTRTKTARAPAAPGGRTGGLGRDGRRGRGRRQAWSKATARGVALRRGAVIAQAADQRHPPWRRLPSVPLRLLGHARPARTGGHGDERRTS